MLQFPDRTYIRSSVLSGFEKFVADIGGDPEHLLRACGIDPGEARCPDDMLSFRSYTRLLEITAASLGRPDLGLRFAETSFPSFQSLGAIPLHAYFASSIGDWLFRVADHLAIFTNAYEIGVSESPTDRQVSVRIGRQGPILLSRQKAEHTVAVAVLLVRRIIDDADWAPSLITFTHDAPVSRSTHDRIFRCPVEFGAEHTAVMAPREDLGRPIKLSEAWFQRSVDGFIRQRHEGNRRFDQSITAMVQCVLSGLLGGCCSSIEFVARMLGMHEKKLQRLLAQEGTSYAAILDTTRRERAGRYLTGSSVAISTIARMLDYDSMPAFSSAFRRWYGTTPRAYRQTSEPGFRPAARRTA